MDTATNDRHAAPARVGLLIANHGSPAAPNPPEVRRYLRSFLSDPRVVEAPRWFWLPILNGIILTTRPRKTAQMYREVWTDQGAPLAVLMDQLGAELAKAMAGDAGGILVEVTSLYGTPSMEASMAKLAAAGVEKLLVLPLYPQYSGSTSAAVFDKVSRLLEAWPRFPELHFINDYSGHDAYITALADSIEAHWAEHGRADRLLVSYHGIPREYFDNGDPYFCYCSRTTRLLAERLKLAPDAFGQSFQSRFGPKEWLQPYTDKLLAEWRDSGVETVDLICPGFAVDCLETLEEIRGEVAQGFAELGGTLRYIECLNATSGHVSALRSLVHDRAGDWLGDQKASLSSAA